MCLERGDGGGGGESLLCRPEVSERKGPCEWAELMTLKEQRAVYLW